MKELLRLHWRLERNHIKRRLGYLRIYFDWAGTVTYLYLAAFFLFLLGWYLYDPFGRIPLPIRQNIVFGGQFLLFAVPMFWLFGGVLRAAFTPVFLSMADAHYLPITPLKKSTIIVEQWFWAVSRRTLSAVCGPLLIYPILRIFWPAYTLGLVGAMQGVWLISGVVGLDIQWILAVPLAWLRRNKIFAWIKGFTVSALFILVVIGLWRLPVGPSGQAVPHTTGVGVSRVTAISGAANETIGPGTFFIVPPSSPATVMILGAAILFAIILTSVVLSWYAQRPWAFMLQQTEQVHTLRTLMRSRDKRALQRYRQQTHRGYLLSKLLDRVYTPPNWALSWKGVLGWKSLSWFQLFSLIMPLLLIRLMLSGAFPRTGANPFEALLGPVLYQQFPLALLVLQGFVGLLTSWQEDLQQMEKFRLLPLYPKQVILSTVAPAGVSIGGFWAVITLFFIPLQGKALVLAALFALVQGCLGAVLVAREMLKDPSSYTSATGPERLVSGAIILLGPIGLQGALIAGQGVAAGLSAGIVIAAGTALVWVFFMQNEYTLLRAKYGV